MTIAGQKHESVSANFQTVFFIAKHEAKPFITASKEAEGHNPGIFNQKMIKIICFKTYM